MPPKPKRAASPAGGQKEEGTDISKEVLSSESEDEEGGVSRAPINPLVGKEEDADEKFERALDDEREQVLEVASKLTDGKLLETVLKLERLNSFSNARFQDILPQVVDGRAFIIDGDSLLMLVLDSKGFSLEDGGQTLHMIYLAEKFLSTFSSKGLNFVVVFFEVWNRCGKSLPHLDFARAALKLHLMYNQKFFRVLSIDSLWSDQFLSLLEDYRAGFIMQLSALPNFLAISMETDDEKSIRLWQQFLLTAQSVYCEFLCLDVVDIATIHCTPASLMATVHTHVNNFGHIKERVSQAINLLEKKMPSSGEATCTSDFPEACVRSSTIILAAAAILETDAGEDTAAVAKTVLLSLALLEHVPLKMRCFKSLSSLPLKVSKLLSKFLSEIADVVSQLPSGDDSPSLDFQLIGDLWHGRFIHAVFNCVSEVGIINCGDLGNIIASRYEELILHVKKLLDGMELQPYPIKHLCDGPCTGHTLEKASPISELVGGKLIPTTSSLAELFTGKLMAERQVFSTELVDFPAEEAMHEYRHWHSKKPLTDEFERIPDDNAKDAEREVNKRYAQNQRNNLARFHTIYGLSLEGRSSVKPIVTNSSKPKENQKKQVDKPKAQPKGKLSKKDKIIEDNIKRIQEDKLKQTKDRLKSFTSNFSSLMLKGDFSGAIEKCDLELQRASDFSEIVLEILFLKGRACFGLWSDECHIKRSGRNLFGAKELFLVIREIFKITEEGTISLSSKEKMAISVWLHELGFKDLCSLKGLLEPPKGVKGSFNVGMNYVEFQLTQLGAELVRETGGKADHRADGFIPDPWQVKLFDIIDKNQSAVVVAPTSSGKTYASYYCMEQVIRGSDDGVVVYVCPTKALVNQVYATIYARFKKNLPPGKTLLGIFTRDFRQNVTNCQILTTIPECMELLLLSPRLQTWAQRIKYVIFDEVHCLVAQSGGLSWENSILLNRSPFLALSATIHKPELFCNWLQKVEDFKRSQAEIYGLRDRSLDSYKVSLVIHSERHNHLIKNVLMNDGSIQHVHPYSFLNPETWNESSCIPKHISLSPDETLELYNVMRKVLHSEEISNLDLIKYFLDLCPSGFLSMQSVQKLTDTLRNILNAENQGNQVKVLKKLQKVDYSDLETGEDHVFQNIPSVLDVLKDKGMLPALVFTYNRSLVQALPLRLLRFLRNLDDFTEDEETDIESDSEEESGKKSGSAKTHRRFKGKKYKRKLGIMRGPSMLKSPGSLRGEGFTDEKLIEFIEHRLIRTGYRASDSFPSLLRRGLGRHFAGMNARERSAVEMLFRLKILNFVSATGTLALGIHMPCKTVVVAGDSPFLNVLEFNQMSGRAGRRGFDKEGNVIFYGLHKRKMEALMTGNLPQMAGNFPLSATLILRLLLLVTDVTRDGAVSQEASSDALARTYTLLENGLLYESNEHLKDIMKFYFSFVVQFLIRQNLLNKEGYPHASAVFITHLHYHEPGNFAFFSLLKSGVLEDICEYGKDGAISQESLLNLMIVLNFLFARLPLSSHLRRRNRINSIVVLPPLPERVVEALKEYNRQVLLIFSHHFKCVASEVQRKFGDETNLPLSQLKVQPEKVLTPETLKEGKVMSVLESIVSNSHVCSVFAGLSGNTDEDLFQTSGGILHIRDDVNVKIVPTLELDFPCNSYALDFYKHGISDAICFDNGLRSGHDFTVLKDFMLVLKSIKVSLTEMLAPDAKLLKAISQICDTFEANFSKAYFAYKGI